MSNLVQFAKLIKEQEHEDIEYLKQFEISSVLSIALRAVHSPA